MSLDSVLKRKVQPDLGFDLSLNKEQKEQHDETDPGTEPKFFMKISEKVTSEPFTSIAKLTAINPTFGFAAVDNSGSTKFKLNTVNTGSVYDENDTILKVELSSVPKLGFTFGCEWNSYAKIVNFTTATIVPAGGTDPNCILKFREQIKIAKVIYIITDGEIDDGCVRRLADQIKEFAHATLIILGVAHRQGEYHNCNISVFASFLSLPQTILLSLTQYETRVIGCSSLVYDQLNSAGIIFPKPALSAKYEDLPLVNLEQLRNAPIAIDNGFELPRGFTLLLDGTPFSLTKMLISTLDITKVEHQEMFKKIGLNLGAITKIAENHGKLQELRNWFDRHNKLFAKAVLEFLDYLSADLGKNAEILQYFVTTYASADASIEIHQDHEKNQLLPELLVALKASVLDPEIIAKMIYFLESLTQTMMCDIQIISSQPSYKPYDGLGPSFLPSLCAVPSMSPMVSLELCAMSSDSATPGACESVISALQRLRPAYSATVSMPAIPESMKPSLPELSVTPSCVPSSMQQSFQDRFNASLVNNSVTDTFAPGSHVANIIEKQKDLQPSI